MDVKKKLVELMCDVLEDGCMGHCNHPPCWKVTHAVDGLIAHGVTVQECGEWVYDHWCEFKCSVCGEFSNSKPYKGKEKYCPNCGAKMIPQPPKGE